MLADGRYDSGTRHIVVGREFVQLELNGAGVRAAVDGRGHECSLSGSILEEILA